MNQYDRLKQHYNRKKVLIVGLGLQGGGVGVARFFSKLGSIVTVTDLKNEQYLSASIQKLSGLPIDFHLGGHTEYDFLHADIVIKGPSIPWDNTFIQTALAHNIPVEMETALFALYCPATIIGVTGTRGKSTTTAMIAQVLAATHKKVHLAGNIPGSATIELIEHIHPEDLVVLELSSFQLSGFHRVKISPRYAVITNFYPDHLNYYHNLNEYWFDKCAIFQYQHPEDVVVAHENLRYEIDKIDHKGKTYFVSDTRYTAPMSIIGSHNRSNASLAYEIGVLFHIPDADITRILSTFSGLPYRQQNVRTIGNVHFINDTTSTTPVALHTALKTFANAPIYLIAGGKTKHLPWNYIVKELSLVKHISWISGSWTDEAYPVIQGTYPHISSRKDLSLEEAVRDSYMHAKKTGGVVLFSPGATSFATFANEFERGKQFNAIVDAIQTI